MKVTFKVKFDTNEIDDRLELNCLVKAKDMAMALWAISHNNKHIVHLEDLIDKINNQLDEHGINLDELTY